MKDIEAKILRFNHLSDEEQEVVESYVQDHDEWSDLLRDVKMIGELTDKVQLLQDPTASDEALAHYAVARHFSFGSTSTRLEAIFRDVEQRLEENPELRRRLDEIEERIEESLHTLDVEAHFERVTGHSLEDAQHDASQAAVTTVGARSRDRSAEEVPLLGWIGRLPTGVRWAAATVVTLLVLYGGLFLVSEWTQEPAQRLAVVDIDETEIEGYEPRVRGEAPANSAEELTADEAYLQALHHLRDAQTTTLGLFPRYDGEALEEARDLLQTVVDDEEAGTFVQLEAHFFLGKTLLAQSHIEEARSHLRTVAMGEGRHTEEAVDILTALEEHYPAYEEEMEMQSTP